MMRGVSIAFVSASWVCAALLGATPPLLAQGSGESVTLAEAMSLFGQNSPQLQLARSRLRFALAEARQDRAVPNPRLAATHEALEDYSESYLTLNQSLDFLWERSDRNTRADALEARARGIFLADSLRMALEARRAYLEAWQRREIVATYQRALEVVDGLVASAEARFEERDVAGYDLRRLRLERLQLGRRMAAAELDLGEAEQQLGALVLDLDDLRPLAAENPGAMETGVPAREGLVARAWANRPEIRSAESLAGALAAAAGLARSSVLSGTSLTGGLKRQADGLDGVFVGLEIPLPVADRRRGARDAAQAEVTAAGWEVDLLRRSIARQVSLAASRLETAQRQSRLLGPSGGEEALELLEIARLSFQEGETRAVDLLDATRAFIEARLLDSELRGELWITYFELEQAVGGPLNDVNESTEGGNVR